MKIGIIGGLGIGMAHAIAAEQLGYEIAWVVDIDTQTARTRYNEFEWVNSWGPLKESVVPKSRPMISHQIPDIPVELTIIATPNDSHGFYLSQVESPKVLLEKPAMIAEDYTFSHKKEVYVGYEWLHLHALQETLNRRAQMKPDREPLVFAQFHNYPNFSGWRKNTSALVDLGSHLFNNLLYMFPTAEAEDFDTEVIVRQQEYVIVLIRDRFSSRRFQLICGYNLHLNGLKTIKGYNTNCSVHETEVIIGERGFGWQEDLFRRQLVALACGDEDFLTPLSRAIEVDILLTRCLNARPLVDV